MTEMPFPIGSNVATTVKIQDSSGNAINAVAGELGVLNIDSLATKLDNLLTELESKLESSELSFHDSTIMKIADKYQYGTLVFEQGQATSTTEIVSGVSGKRIILTFVAISLSGAAEWYIGYGSALQDKLVVATSTTWVYLIGTPIQEGTSDDIWVYEVSGSETCRYTVTGVIAD